MKVFKKRRKDIAKQLPKKSLLVLSSYPEYLRQTDVYHPYRQDSFFYYLTAFTQAQSFFMLSSSGLGILMIKDKDPKKEQWDGPLYTKSDVKRGYAVDKVFYLSEIDTVVKKYFKNIETLFYEKERLSHRDFLFFYKLIKNFKGQKKSAFEFLKNFRRVKSLEEIQSIKKACSYSIQAHKELARALKPGIGERKLHGLFIRSIMEQGAEREAYPSIIASGSNALILHYIKNNSLCKKGELLLVDAGAEADYYASDITRIYPVSGRFSKAQKQAYQLLLKLQKQLIQKVRPGITFKELNHEMRLGLTDILLELGILKGSLEKNLKAEKYKAYCPHSVGHLLGLDVHDVTFKKSEPSFLEENMVLTIEPGLYIPENDPKASKGLQGMGLRIEDNILVTKKACHNLTKNIAKEVEEIEKLCSSA